MFAPCWSVYILPNTSNNIASYYLCIRKVYESNINKEATNMITNEGKKKKKKKIFCFAFSQKFRFFVHKKSACPKLTAKIH